MNKEDKQLGWKLYECLKHYHKYHLPLDEDVPHSPYELMNEVYDYFELEPTEDEE